jgi:hypothetical protein
MELNHRIPDHLTGSVYQEYVYMSINFYPETDYGFARRMFWGRAFGLFIREFREKKSRSVEDVSHLAGMEASSWNAIEAGLIPDPEQLHPMADALGLGHDGIERLAMFCQDAWSD